MAFSVISISSDSSKERVGMSTARVILFGTILTTIPSIAPTVDLPVIHDDTPLIPTDTPTISLIDPYEVTVARGRSRVAARSSPPSSPIRQILPVQPGLPRRPAILVLPKQPIFVGRLYCTQPNRVLKMLTARKRVGPLPTHRLALRYPVDYSSSDHFTSNDSSRDSPSDSSSKISSNSYSDTSSDSSSRHSSSGYAISDSPYDSPTAIFAGASRKRCRSPTLSVPVASPVPGALSPVRTDLLLPCKRIRYSDSETDFQVSSEEGYVLYVPREIGLGVDVEDSYEPYNEPDIDPDVQANINACIAFSDDIAARGTDVRVEIGTAAKEEAESSARGTIEIEVDRVTHPVISDDIVEHVREDFLELVSANESLEVMQRGLDVVMQELYDHMVEISVHRVRVIESRDNRRLRGMLDVERQRVNHLRRSMSYVQKDLRQIRRFRFYDRVRFGRLETYARRHLDPTLENRDVIDYIRCYEICFPIIYVMITMPTATRSGMTQDAINELISKRVEEALKAYDAARNPRTETEMENDQQDDNVKVNGNNGNGNGNGNENPNVNNEGVVPVTRERTYQDFVKCQPLNFKGTEGVVCLTSWFEKMETIFHISNCPPMYQVKYASCTLLDGALTWWNSHKRTVGRDEHGTILAPTGIVPGIKNRYQFGTVLVRFRYRTGYKESVPVRDGTGAAYAMTWKALMKLMTEVYCPRNEIQKMETELWNLTVKGNDLTAYNQRFQELTLLCTKMVPKEEDQVEKYIGGLPDNIQGNVIAAEPVRLQDAIHIANNLMDQKLNGYTMKNAENKRRFDNNSRDNHGQQQPFKRQNVHGQNVARADMVGNHVERRGYTGALPYCSKNECPKLRNQNRGNKKGNKSGNNEAKARAYAIGGGGANPDSNVVTGTFLLNNRYATMLFDSGADESFVSTTFSSLLDIIPSTLDVSYAVELADGIILETNVILRGCTLGLLGHPFDIDLMC
ncbi:reverse transcriptase domain-containing protein [Tanacetum coccineum]|uniref:Reverse transcriptase domain-containing protein n=1 Tax=Tanacetum coccineum TaxID=301880 RepID=A0ABQ5HTI5_9ASTR